jgi:hypothetical protein
MTAATFFAKTKMGWTERVVNKHAKKDGKPLLVDDARQRLIELHLCRGELDRDAWRLDRCPYLRLLGDTRAGLKLCNVGGTLSVADSTLAFTPLT